MKDSSLDNLGVDARDLEAEASEHRNLTAGVEEVGQVGPARPTGDKGTMVLGRLRGGASKV